MLLASADHPGEGPVVQPRSCRLLTPSRDDVAFLRWRGVVTRYLLIGCTMSRPVSGRTRIAGAALAFVAMACGLLWIAEPAQAHDQLIESTPANGETLQVPPEEVVLQFSGDLIELGDLVYDGSGARIALKDGMSDGWYEIRWQVVSRDGHPISGIIPFAIGDAGGQPPGTAPSTTPAAGASDGQDGADTGESGVLGAMRIVLIGLTGAAIAAGGYWLASRLMRRRGTHPSTDEPGSP